MRRRKKLWVGAMFAGFLGLQSLQAAAQTSEPAQMSGNTFNTVGGWTVKPLITVGEQNGAGQDINLKKFGYRVPGILDGIGVFPGGRNEVLVLVNHEFNSDAGYTYKLANGTPLTGARVSYFKLDTRSKKVTAAGLAYDTVFDRAGAMVSNETQINEGADVGGFDRLCSAYGIKKADGNFTTDLYFTGEETSSGLGGQEAVIDVRNKVAYFVPMLGRAAFENVTTVDTKGTNKVALIIGDDRAPAPLLLFIGEKGSVPAGRTYNPPQFLIDNGLANGNLYVWVADNGDTTPQEFNGTGNDRTGKFVKIAHFDPAQAGMPGYDSLGFASLTTQDALAASAGAFLFSRPEDVATNPHDGTQVVMASTGRGQLYPADNWGTIYRIDLEFVGAGALNQPLADIDNISANLDILYDGDDAGNQDFGIRSPDNLDWSANGMIYINEDRSTSPGSLFGGISGIDASAWQLDPATGVASRILEMNRSAVPQGQTDPDPTDIGNWESSGVVDVSEFFDTKKTMLIMTTQAHNVRDGLIGGSENLVEGGQLFLAEGGERDAKRDHRRRLEPQ